MKLITSPKSMSTLIIGATCALMVTAATAPAHAADTYAKYETQAAMGKITQMPGKSKRKVIPRRVNHARYDVMAEKGTFLIPRPKHKKKTPAQLAKRYNHAEYDTQHSSDHDG